MLMKVYFNDLNISKELDSNSRRFIVWMKLYVISAVNLKEPHAVNPALTADLKGNVTFEKY